jgi:hypothetical protein
MLKKDRINQFCQTDLSNKHQKVQNINIDYAMPSQHECKIMTQLKLNRNYMLLFA